MHVGSGNAFYGRTGVEVVVVVVLVVLFAIRPFQLYYVFYGMLREPRRLQREAEEEMKNGPRQACPRRQGLCWWCCHFTPPPPRIHVQRGSDDDTAAAEENWHNRLCRGFVLSMGGGTSTDGWEYCPVCTCRPLHKVVAFAVIAHSLWYL